MSERVQLMCLEKSDIEATLKERVRCLENELQSGQIQQATMETHIREAQAEAHQAQVRCAESLMNS